jgi:hypothetical protein
VVSPLGLLFDFPRRQDLALHAFLDHADALKAADSVQ